MGHYKAICVFCERAFGYSDSQAGKKVRCPNCKSPNELPQIPVSADAPVSANDSIPSKPKARREMPKKRATTNSSVRRESGFRKANTVFGIDGAWKSRFAAFCNGVGKGVLVLAIFSQTYIFIISDWEALGRLPIKVAIGAFAALVTVPSVLFLISLAVFGMSHVIEYQCRNISGQREVLSQLQAINNSDEFADELARMANKSAEDLVTNQEIHY